MKKFSLILLVMVLVAGLIMSSCSSSTASPVKTSAPAQSAAPAGNPNLTGKVVFETTPSGSIGHNLGIAWSTIIKKYIPGLQMSLDPATGLPQAFGAFMQGQGDMSVLASNICGEQLPKYIGGKTLASGPYNLISRQGSATHIFTRAASGINSIADFKGKKILGKNPGAPANDLLRQKILAAYGLTDNDIVLLSGNNGQHLTQQLAEGVGDAVIALVSMGDVALIDVFNTKSMQFLPLPPEKITFAEEFWVQTGFIPAGTYRGQDKDVPAIIMPNSVVARNNMDEELAYNLVKVMYEHWDEFAAMDPAEMKQYSINETLKAWFLPFHPGAVKYYKEKGVWTKEMDTKQQQLMQKVIAPAPAKPQ